MGHAAGRFIVAVDDAAFVKRLKRFSSMEIEDTVIAKTKEVKGREMYKNVQHQYV